MISVLRAVALTLMLVFAVNLLSVCPGCGPMAEPHAGGTVQAAEVAPIPIVVLLYDEHCKITCNQVRPILAELKTTFAGKVEFLDLNISEKTMPESKRLAKEQGVLSFLADYAEYIPMVGVFSVKRRLVKQLQGPKSKEVYVTAIEKALAAK